MATESTKKRKAFVPLECNPEVMTGLVHKLGLSPSLSFHDVYSLSDPELLAFVPRPVYALLFVFPITERYEKTRIQEDSSTDEYTSKSKEAQEQDVIWYKQTIKNACGLVGVLHAVSNGQARDHILPKTTLAEFIRKATPLDPIARAELIETTDALESAHQQSAAEGSSAAPSAEDEVDLHYVCFVKSQANNHLYELDGRRKGPLDRVELDPTDDVFSPKALKIVQDMIKEESGNLNFSLVALAPSLE